jgi:hypothetical protein
MELDEFLGARTDWSETSRTVERWCFGRLLTSGFGDIPMVLRMVVQIGIVSCHLVGQ